MTRARRGVRLDWTHPAVLLVLPVVAGAAAAICPPLALALPAAFTALIALLSLARFVEARDASDGDGRG